MSLNDLEDETMIQQTIARLLGKPEALSAADCKARMAEIATRLQEIESRQADIGYGFGGYQQGQVPGPVRLKAATTGKPADLIALDAELLELEAESESLHIQRDELKKAAAAAELRNAPVAAAAAIRALPKALKAHMAAQAALDAARAEVERLKDSLTVNRRAAEVGNIECPALTPELFEELADALGLIPTTSTPVYAENVRVTRQTWRVAMTGIKTEPPKQPEMPWQEMERRRRGEAQARERGYLQDTKGPLAEKFN